MNVGQAITAGIRYGDAPCPVVCRDPESISCVQICVLPWGHDGLHTANPGAGSGFDLAHAIRSWHTGPTGVRRSWRRAMRIASGLERP